MIHSPSTQPSLLVRLRDSGDELAWSHFVGLYGPLVYSWLRQRGLQDADVADLTQDVLRQVAVSVRTFEYSPQRGAFRGWLYTVVRNRLRTFCDRELKKDVGRWRGEGGTGAFEKLSAVIDDTVETADEWDRAFERQLMSHAVEVIRPDFAETTWRAFWLTAVEGRRGIEAADELGMTPAAVYLARSRVLQKLKEQVRLLSE